MPGESVDDYLNQDPLDVLSASGELQSPAQNGSRPVGNPKVAADGFASAQGAMHSLKADSPRGALATSILAQAEVAPEFRSVVGSQLFAARNDGVEPIPVDRSSSAKTGTGQLFVSQSPSDNPVSNVFGFYGQANHEAEHANHQTPQDTYREVAPAVGDIVFATEQFRSEQGKEVEHQVNLPGGVTHDANWMNEQAKEHGYWGGRSMQDLLTNTPEGRQWAGQMGRDESQLNTATEPPEPEPQESPPQAARPPSAEFPKASQSGVAKQINGSQPRMSPAEQARTELRRATESSTAEGYWDRYASARQKAAEYFPEYAQAMINQEESNSPENLDAMIAAEMSVIDSTALSTDVLGSGAMPRRPVKPTGNIFDQGLPEEVPADNQPQDSVPELNQQEQQDQTIAELGKKFAEHRERQPPVSPEKPDLSQSREPSERRYSRRGSDRKNSRLAALEILEANREEQKRAKSGQGNSSHPFGAARMAAQPSPSDMAGDGGGADSADPSANKTASDAAMAGFSASQEKLHAALAKCLEAMAQSANSCTQRLDAIEAMIHRSVP